jgi:CO/xanthine dehydrogenase FAD-binding subunit
VRTAISTLTLLEPRSLREAFRMLRDEAPLVPVAGCTDLYVGVNFGTLAERRFLNLWQLDELRRIDRRGRALSIGALATYSAIIGSSLVRKQVPMLVAAAAEIGGIQIQNRGTLGGNIVNGSPAGDTLPVLAAADAVLLLGCSDGTRRVAFNEFYTGYRTSVLRPDELLLAIEIPRIDGQQWFRKVGTRAAQAISKVVMAAVRAPEPRVAIGSVAPTVVRARRTEAALAAGDPIEAARRIFAAEIAPIDDLRSTADYRRTVAANLLEKFWRDTNPE